MIPYNVESDQIKLPTAGRGILRLGSLGGTC